MTNQTNAYGHDDLFTAKTTGLPELARPGVLGPRDGDRLDLRICPAGLNIGGAELRMAGTSTELAR